MNLPTEIFGSVIVVHTPEEVAGDQALLLAQFATTLERNNVVLDLDHTELIDSRGLTSLLDMQESLRKAGGDMKLATTSPTNRKIFEITRLDQQLEIFETVVDAVRSFR